MDPAAAKLFCLFGIGVVLTLVVGFYCILSTKNLIRTLIGIEILAKAVTILIILAGYVSHQIALAQSLAITMIVLEVAVIVVAVGIVLCVYRRTDSIETTNLRNLKG